MKNLGRVCELADVTKGKHSIELMSTRRREEQELEVTHITISSRQYELSQLALDPAISVSRGAPE